LSCRLWRQADLRALRDRAGHIRRARLSDPGIPLEVVRAEAPELWPYFLTLEPGLSTTLASSRQWKLLVTAGGGEGGQREALVAMGTQDGEDELGEQHASGGGHVAIGAAAASRGKWPPQGRPEQGEGEETTRCQADRR